MSRLSWDDIYIRMCDLVSERATCNRKHVGAVITIDNRVVATGYNGSLPGTAHCDDAGHDMQDNHCVRTIHAEINALAQAAKMGISVDGATLYCNTVPCWDCFKTIVSAGIKEVVYKDEYPSKSLDRVCAFADGADSFTLRQHIPGDDIS